MVNSCHWTTDTNPLAPIFCNETKRHPFLWNESFQIMINNNNWLWLTKVIFKNGQNHAKRPTDSSKTIQYSAIQYSTIQYSTIQWMIIMTIVIPMKEVV